MGLSKVIQQIAPQAMGSLAVADHLLQPAQVPGTHCGPVFLGEVGAVSAVLNEMPGRDHIAGGIQQDAVRRSAVPSRTASLLVVGFWACCSG